MSKLASNILIVAGVLTGLLFFKWFLIPIALGLFLAAILLYLKKLFHIKKLLLLTWWFLFLGVVGVWIWEWWSQLMESIWELVTSVNTVFTSITSVIESRRGISIQAWDMQTIYERIQWIASALPLWSFSIWFMGLLIDGLLILVYSFLFVLYDKKIVSALSVFSPHASTYWKVGIKKSAQYIGSLLTISLILSALYSLILLTLWVQYALLIAIVAWFCTLVPTVWTVIGIIWATIAAYAVTGSTTTALIVFISFECIQLLEEYTILPAIAWKKLDINPLATILWVVFGGIIWWVAWIFLILPVVSILQEIIADSNQNHRFLKFTR